MTRLIAALTFCVLFALAAPGALAQLDTPVPQQAILRLEDGVLIDDVLTTYNATLEATIFGGSRPHYLIGLPPELPEDEFLLLAENDDRIKDAELNFTAAAPDPSTGGFFLPSRSSRYDIQSATLVTDLDSAPYVQAPSPVTVAVIDTGVDPSHPRLAGHVRPDGVSFIPGSPTTNDIGDGADNDNDGLTDELVGHGTFVAGLVHRVAPDARILPIRVLDSDGGGNVFRVAQGIREAINLGADVISLSLGTTAHVSALGRQIEDANALGILVFASAGNDNTQDPVRFPAADIGVIAVAATNHVDLRASFSNYGTHIDLSAPGVDVVSILPGSTYASSSGTSFSTPLATGLAARILAVNPALTPAEVSLILASSAEPIDDLNPGFEGLLGAGRINVRQAMILAGLDAIPGDITRDGNIGMRDLFRLLSGRDVSPVSQQQPDAPDVTIESFHTIVNTLDER